MKEKCNAFVSPHPAMNAGPCHHTSHPSSPCHDHMADNTTELAEAYIPSQPFTEPMGREQSLVCGTAFADLVRPYCSGWHLYRNAKEV